MQLLDGKLCVITGASRGMGEAIALAFAKEGASLILAARDLTKLEELEQQCKSQGAKAVEKCAVDFSDSKDVQSFGVQILERHPSGVHCLVNNAGTFARATPTDGDPDEWERLFAVNVLAPMRLTRIFAPGMEARQSGVIINMCSVAALDGMKGAGGLCATKFALRGWSLSCYEAMREHNVKVMAINPGYVNTVDRGSNWNYDRMIQLSDIAEVALLPFKTSAGCCPQEITLRNTRPVVE